jgi:hypothetical protein
MKKADHLKSLLELLTVDQLLFYNKIYPTGATTPSELDNSIRLVVSTIHAANENEERNRNKVKELEGIVIELTNQVSSLSAIVTTPVTGVASRIRDYDEMTERCVHGEECIECRLTKLSLLENGGVDNWEWYSESLNASL